MGDVLPPKRTVVERLRLRLERYRWHHNSCLPRYEQTANSLTEKQRQDTIRLKQRFLESKAKKTKNNKSDHHRAPVAVRESTPDAQKLVSHSKPNKIAPDVGSPANPTTDPPTDDLERSTKTAQPDNGSSESMSTSEQPHPATPKFSLPVVQQFPNCNTTVQTGSTTSESSLPPSVPISQNQSLVPKQTKNVSSQSQNHTSQIENSSNVKCKQEEEKPPDLCQFKTPPPSSDRLSDTFPSIGFAEDSGDNVIHPDLLKDLIDDVFTNSGDIQDFDFEDSVCSMKDDEKDDIDELVKASTPVSQIQPFHSNNIMFNSHSMSQTVGSSLFGDSIVTTSATLTPVSSTATPSVTTSSLYGSHQRLPTYSSTNLANNLGLDFKLTEPSPAALTLKQMAEQHQNMQQKQQQLNSNLTSPFNLRNQFGLDSFSDPMSNFSTRFLTRPVQRSQTSSMFQSMPYEPRFPGVVPITDNILFKQESFNIGTTGTLINAENQKHLQMARPAEKKQPPCATDRSEFYQDSIMQPNPNQHGATTQYMGNITSDVQMHIDQAQQISPANNGRSVRSVTRDIKQTDASQLSFPNMYSYTTQPGNEHLYHLPMNQTPFTAQYNIQSSNHRPPPEYKISQTTIRPNNVVLDQNQLQPSPPYHRQLMPQQRLTNVANNQWRTVHQPSHGNTDLFQHQDGYGNLNCIGAIPSSVHHSPMHHPYRTVGNVSQMPSNRLSSPVGSSSNTSLQQQVSLHHQQQHSINSGLPNLNLNLGTTATNLYSGHQDLNSRQDNSQLNLDFLDHIESSAPELLNFDNVIQNSDTTHFQLLDDMEMLGK